MPREMQTWSEGAESKDGTTVFRARAFQRDATAGNNQISGAIPRDRRNRWSRRTVGGIFDISRAHFRPTKRQGAKGETERKGERETLGRRQRQMRKTKTARCPKTRSAKERRRDREREEEKEKDRQTARETRNSRQQPATANSNRQE